VLEDLAATFAETAHLAVLEGATVRYLDAVESSRALRVAARTGAALPALTKRSVTRLPKLQAELRLVRERGYAINQEESEDGVASGAVAVLGETTRRRRLWSSPRR
jgi:IclR family transcriptional regulator, acetate operon repressor